MKHMMSLFLFFILSVFNAFAQAVVDTAPAAEASQEEAPAAAEEAPWQFVCEYDDLSFITDQRYFLVASSDDYPEIAADGKTIQIDRKKKTIKVWTVWLASEQKRQSLIEEFGQDTDYSAYGYDKGLDVIDYRSMKYLSKSTTRYNCNGSIKESFGADNSWNDIIPGSVMEAMVETIIEKYKLK